MRNGLQEYARFSYHSPRASALEEPLAIFYLYPLSSESKIQIACPHLSLFSEIKLTSKGAFERHWLHGQPGTAASQFVATMSRT